MADKKKSPAVPPRGTEVTLVADFPRPATWFKRNTAAGDAKEIAVMRAKGWHPTTDDFMVVAQVPNTGKKRTEIFTVHNVGEMLGAILDLGSGDVARRPKRSILRLNIISHGIAQPGKPTLCGLGGTIEDDGTCKVNLSVSERSGPQAPMRGGLDESVLAWLNSTAASIRDDCRERFREDGEIGLVLCNGGGVDLSPVSQQFMPALARTFNVRVRGYDDEVLSDNTFDEQTLRFVERDLTKIGKRERTATSFGFGYFCAVPAPEKLAGKHLEFNRDASKPAPAKP
jgi:hypothetical protein